MEKQPRGNGSRGLLIGLLVAAALALAACAVVAVLAAGIFAARLAFRAPDAPLVPVTGGDPPAAPPQPAPTPRAGSNYYIDQAEQTLLVCYISFNAFFNLEQLALDEPSLFTSELWREDAREAAVQFREDCNRLAELPEAPPGGYAELEFWLLLTAGEAVAAEESFHGVLDAGESGVISFDSLRETTDHLVLFIEYSDQADIVLEKLKNQPIIRTLPALAGL